MTNESVLRAMAAFGDREELTKVLETLAWAVVAETLGRSEKRKSAYDTVAEWLREEANDRVDEI